jgi:NTE family protein
VIPRIGVAVSGGGFRAACFGLGCLRALNDRDLLRHVKVISGISGGSLLTALYAYGPESFAEFDQSVTDVLSDGLQLAVITRAFNPAVATRNLLGAARAGMIRHPKVLRGSTRTDALRHVLAQRCFGSRAMSQVTHRGLDTVITATDLRTKTAMRYGSARSAAWRYGTLTQDIPVAEAVAASAAFPLLLPAVERRYEFLDRRGIASDHLLYLTDGGVYDNLGVSVLEPGRSAEYTSHVYDLDYVIACDAGPGEPRLSKGHFAAARLKNSFDTVHKRAQDAARARLHDFKASGRLKGFVHVYLGIDDWRTPTPIADLVPRSAVSDYPTNFAAMSPESMSDISLRAEQLTASLLDRWCPDLC